MSDINQVLSELISVLYKNNEAMGSVINGLSGVTDKLDTNLSGMNSIQKDIRNATNNINKFTTNINNSFGGMNKTLKDMVNNAKKESSNNYNKSTAKNLNSSSDRASSSSNSSSMLLSSSKNLLDSSKNLNRAAMNLNMAVSNMMKNFSNIGRNTSSSNSSFISTSSSRNKNDDEQFNNTKKEANKLFNSFNNMGSSSLKLSKSLYNLNGDLRGLSSSIQTLTFGFFGLKAINGLFSEMSEGVSETIGSYREMAKFGQSFNGSIMEMALMASEASMPLEAMTKAVKEHSEVISMVGIKSFVNLDKNVRTAMRDVGQFGLTTQETTDMLAQYMDLQRLSSTLSYRSQSDMTDGFKKVVGQATALSAVTGKQREEILKTMRQASEETRLRLKLATLDEKSRVEVQKNMETAALFMASMPGEAGSMLTKMLSQTVSDNGALFAESTQMFYEAGLGRLTAPMERLARVVNGGTVQVEDITSTLKEMGDVSDAELENLRVQAMAGNESARKMADMVLAIRQGTKNIDQFAKSLKEANEKKGVTNFLLNLEDILNRIGGAFRTGFLKSLDSIMKGLEKFGSSAAFTNLLTTFEEMGLGFGKFIDKLINSGQLEKLGETLSKGLIQLSSWFTISANQFNIDDLINVATTFIGAVKSIAAAGLIFLNMIVGIGAALGGIISVVSSIGNVFESMGIPIFSLIGIFVGFTFVVSKLSSSFKMFGSLMDKFNLGKSNNKNTESVINDKSSNSIKNYSEMNINAKVVNIYGGSIRDHRGNRGGGSGPDRGGRSRTRRGKMTGLGMGVAGAFMDGDLDPTDMMDIFDGNDEPNKSNDTKSNKSSVAERMRNFGNKRGGFIGKVSSIGASAVDYGKNAFDHGKDVLSTASGKNNVLGKVLTTIGDIAKPILPAVKEFAKKVPLIGGALVGLDGALNFISANDDYKSGKIDEKEEMGQKGSAAGGVVGTAIGGALGILGGPVGVAAGMFLGNIVGEWAGKNIGSVFGESGKKFNDDNKKTNAEIKKQNEADLKKQAEADNKKQFSTLQESLLPYMEQTKETQKLTKELQELRKNPMGLDDKELKDKISALEESIKKSRDAESKKLNSSDVGSKFDSVMKRNFGMDEKEMRGKLEKRLSNASPEAKESALKDFDLHMKHMKRMTALPGSNEEDIAKQTRQGVENLGLKVNQQDPTRDQVVAGSKDQRNDEIKKRMEIADKLVALRKKKADLEALAKKNDPNYDPMHPTRNISDLASEERSLLSELSQLNKFATTSEMVSMQENSDLNSSLSERAKKDSARNAASQASFFLADGGVIDSTTALVGSGPKNIGIMAESGPEAVVPLSRGPGGKLGISSFGGNSTNNMSVKTEMNQINSLKKRLIELDQLATEADENRENITEEEYNAIQEDSEKAWIQYRDKVVGYTKTFGEIKDDQDAYLKLVKEYQDDRLEAAKNEKSIFSKVVSGISSFFGGSSNNSGGGSGGKSVSTGSSNRSGGTNLQSSNSSSNSVLGNLSGAKPLEPPKINAGGVGASAGQKAGATNTTEVDTAYSGRNRRERVQQIDENLGAVSERFETGGRGAGLISSGKGDHGGKSYGSHQLSSSSGTLNEYLKQSKYAKEFEGLTPGSAEFDAKWKQLGSTKEFANDQKDFISKSHYQPQMNKLSKAGYDLSGRGRAVQEAVYSTATQYRNMTTGLFKDAIGDKENLSKMSDEDIIIALQRRKLAGVDRDFKSSDEKNRKGVRNRIPEEEKMLLQIAKQKQTNISSPTDIAALPVPTPNDKVLEQKELMKNQMQQQAAAAAAENMRLQKESIEVQKANVAVTAQGMQSLERTGKQNVNATQSALG